MAFTPDQTNAIAAAYQAGNIGEVNNLLAAANMTADQANSVWGSGISDLATQAGVQFAPAPTGGLPTAAPTTVDQLYTSILGRQAETEGKDYWTQQFGDTVDANELATFKNAAAAELANTGYGALPTTSAPASNNYFTANKDVADAYTANNYGMTPDQFAQYHYNNYGQNEGRADPTAAAPVSAPTPDYNQIVTDAYGTIGRTGIGADASNVDQAGLDYWKGELAAGRIKPEEFSSVFGNAVRQYKLDNPNDTYTQYVNNYQLGQQADAMKTGLESVFADKQVSWDEANQINDYYTQYGFKPEDIARVTGRSLDEVNEALGARGNYIGQNITANLDSPVGLINYAQENKLSAKDLASASGGVLSEVAAQALLDKGSTYAGKIELQSPEAYNQIKGIISRAVGHDYGGQEADWMYKMFGGLEKGEVSQAPQQLDVIPSSTQTLTGYGEAGDPYTYDVVTPATVKDTSGLRVVETDENGRPTKYVKDIDSKDFNLKPGEQSHSGTQGLVAEYDANGKLTGYSSGNRIYTSDQNWVGAKWNPDGTPAAYGGYTGGGGFVKGLGNDVAGFTESLGPLWTAAKIAFPELNLVDVGADVARSEVDLNTGVKAAVGTAGYMDADAANAVSGLDGGNAVMNTAQLNTANNLRLGATAVTAAQAAEQGNYAPLLALGANVSGINKMPQVAASMNVLSAANAIATNNPAALMSAAGNLTGSSDLKLAGSATRLINAINSGDQAAIAVAGMAFSSAVKTNAPNAASTLKTTLFGPSTTTSDAGPMSGINVASAGNDPLQVDVGGVPIYAGTAKAASVSEPVGYRLMTMDEADARPEGSYYDITQNAWFAPDEGGMSEISDLRDSLTGKVPEGYSTDVTVNQNPTDNIGEMTVTADRPVVDSMGEIVVTADRPTANDMGEIVVTADRPTVDDMGEIVVTADRPTTEDPVVTPPVVKPPVVTTPSGGTSTPKTTKPTSLGVSTATPSSAPSFLPPEPGKFKKISEDFTPLNPLLFALAGVGPLKGTLEERLDDKEETKKKMPSLADILFAPTPTQEQPPSSYAPVARNDGDGSTPAPDATEQPEQIIPAYAQGGLTGMHPMGEPQFYSQGGLGSMHVQGDGDGTSDSVPAMVAKDEFVLPADVVSSLGNGSSEAGASVLDNFVEIIRQHKHSNQPSELPPQSKGPLEYLSSAMKKGHA